MKTKHLRFCEFLRKSLKIWGRNGLTPEIIVIKIVEFVRTNYDKEYNLSVKTLRQYAYNLPMPVDLIPALYFVTADVGVLDFMITDTDKMLVDRGKASGEKEFD